MKFSTKVSQRASVFIITAFLIATAAMFSTSFILEKQAHALDGVVSAVDTEAPTVPGVPTTATPTKNATMEWSWSAATDLSSDPTVVASGLKGYQYRFSDNSGTIIDWTDTTATSLTTTAQFDGFYQLEVRAVDNAGNIGTASVGSAQLDQTPPTVSITSPTNGTTVDATKKITIVGSTGDASSYTLSIGKTGQTPVGFTSGSGIGFGSYTWDTTNVPGGTYIATLTGTDLVGNVSSAEVLIIVAGTTVPTGPTITVNSAKYTSRPIVVTGTVSSDVTRITITVLDSKGKVVETGVATYTPGKTTWSYTVKANLANATYTVQARGSNNTGSFVDGKANIVVSIQCYLLTLLEALLSYWFF
ncbi:MAG: oprF5 [Candidatus Saccharibacteria bacterium]|nr:oprF5 [Candidatus Saccharibacteria bacterium]